ncbi:MAG: single-stranded DNA-binding protein [Campylobacterales bacterium]
MFNKVILVGNLTRDIELRYTQGGMAIAKTGIATNRKFKKQSGEQLDETMFIDITFFGRSGEVANQYLRKGSKVLVEGRLMLEQWTDQNGQKRSKHSINVEEMKMLDSRGDAQQGGYNAPTGNSGYNAPQPQQGYNAPQPQQQEGYNPPPQPQQQAPQPQNAYQPPKQQMPENTIPEIDIDEDEIPF